MPGQRISVSSSTTLLQHFKSIPFQILVFVKDIFIWCLYGEKLLYFVLCYLCCAQPAFLLPQPPEDPVFTLVLSGIYKRTVE